MQYYLHNFLTSQPDLNLHNPEVQDAMLDVVRFWLKRGVDGFRLDTINFYFHDRNCGKPGAGTGTAQRFTAPAVIPITSRNISTTRNVLRTSSSSALRAVLNEFRLLRRG